MNKVALVQEMIGNGATGSQILEALGIVSGKEVSITSVDEAQVQFAKAKLNEGADMLGLNPILRETFGISVQQAAQVIMSAQAGGF